MNRDVEYWYNRRTNRWHQWERDQNRIIHNFDLPLFCGHAPTEYERMLAHARTTYNLEEDDE